MTYLVVPVDNRKYLAGFFALANAVMDVGLSELNSKRKRYLKKYGTWHPGSDSVQLAAILIAQLGKNYAGTSRISGHELMRCALSTVAEAQRMIGGRITYMECSDNEKLIEFYEREGFGRAGTRKLREEELIRFFTIVSD